MTIQHFFSSEYLFDAIPPKETRLFWPLIIIFSLWVVLGIIVPFIPSKIKDLNRRFGRVMLFPGIVGLLYVFGRNQRLPWLGARVTLLSIAVIFLFWFLYTTVWAIRHVPKKLKEQAIEDRYKQYLPKPKRG